MTEKNFLRDYFPSNETTDYIIEASERPGFSSGKRVLGRFPLGFPDFNDTHSKDWNLVKYEDDLETFVLRTLVHSLLDSATSGEPGGWMIEDSPGSQTHKGTPTSMEDIKNLVLLKRKSDGRMVVEFVDEAFNFRPTIRHKVYTLEEAEALMSAKQKPKLASALKAQFDKKTTTKDESDQEEGEQRKVKKAKKQDVAEDNPEDSRAARTLREVIAVDALIDEIRPEDVEDWEYDEEADDDDVNMGEGDFAEEEQYELEAEYKKYAGSESSEDELDERGKHLKKLIKKGPTITVPSTAAPTTEPVQTKDPASRNEVASAKEPVQVKEPVPRNEPVPSKELSRADLIQYLQRSGPLPLKAVIDFYKPCVKTKEQKHHFIQLVKEVATIEGNAGGSRVVVVRQNYR